MRDDEMEAMRAAVVTLAGIVMELTAVVCDMAADNPKADPVKAAALQKKAEGLREAAKSFE